MGTTSTLPTPPYKSKARVPQEETLRMEHAGYTCVMAPLVAKYRGERFAATCAGFRPS